MISAFCNQVRPAPDVPAGSTIKYSEEVVFDNTILPSEAQLSDHMRVVCIGSASTNLPRHY